MSHFWPFIFLFIFHILTFMLFSKFFTDFWWIEKMRKYCICKGFMTRGYVKYESWVFTTWARGHLHNSKSTYILLRDSLLQNNTKCFQSPNPYLTLIILDKMIKAVPFLFDSSNIPRLTFAASKQIVCEWILFMCDKKIYLGRWRIPRNEPIRNVSFVQ